MPQKTAKIIQSICPRTYPLATKIKAVTPISEQAKVRQSLFGTQRKDNATTTSEVIQSILSKMLKSLNGFFSFFIFLSFLLFKGRQRGATQFSTAYQPQKKKASLCIYKDLTIHKNATWWQKYLIQWYFNILALICQQKLLQRLFFYAILFRRN